MNKCDFDKYRKSGSIHWTAISRSIKNHNLAFDARYRMCVNLLQYLFRAKKAPSILDLGCGDGTLFYYLKKAFPEASLSGIDGSQEGIDLAKAYLTRHFISNVELRVLGFDNLDSISTQYDIVISLEVIEHVENTTQFLASIWNLLRDNGHMLLSTPVKLREFPKDKHHCREFFQSELNALIEKAGFDIIKHVQIIPIYYLTRYFHATRFCIGKSKLYKKYYNLLNIFFKYNTFLKKAPDASYELYESQFVLAKKKEATVD